LVEDGLLRGFLLNRMPIKGFPRSNGHGRREPGHAAVARMGNTIVEASRTVPPPSCAAGCSRSWPARRSLSAWSSTTSPAATP